MRIRKSTEQDFDRMMEIYDYARGYMAKTGNPLRKRYDRVGL